MATNARDVNVRVGLDPTAYTAGATQVSLSTKRMLAQQEAADRKWRAMQGAHQAALNTEAAREQAVADASAAAEKKKRDALAATNKALLIGGAALVAFAAISVKEFGEYSAKMAQVQALTRANASDMQALGAATTKYAKDYGISATQAADAEVELVKAGISTKDIIGGALTGALTLAAAGQIDVADATEIAAAAMTQFNLKGKDVSHVADLLAAGADKSLGNVQDLGDAMKYVGPVAHTLGVNIESTVGVISDFAKAGIIGQQAGTGMRGMLLSLTSPSKEASDTMDQLGINLFDAKGKFIGLAGMAEQLHVKLDGLTQAQQAQALGQIFGNRQVTEAAILMKQGAAGVNKWTKTVDQNGFAAEQAGGKLNSLNGDVDKLKATLTNDFIAIGQQSNGPLRDVVKDVTAVVDVLGDMPDAAKQALLVIAGGGGLALLGIAGMNKLVKVIGTAKLNLQTLGITGRTAGVEVATGMDAAAVSTFHLSSYAGAASEGFGTLATRTGLTAVALLGVSSALKGIQNGLTNASETSTGVTTDLLGLASGAQSAQDAFNGLGDGHSVKNLQDAVKVLDDPSIAQKVANWSLSVATFGKTTGTAKVAAQKMFDAIDQGLAGLVSGGHADKAAAALDKLGLSTQDQAKYLPKYKNALQDASNAQQESAVTTSTLTSKQQAAQAQYKASVTAVQKWATTVSGAGSAMLDFSKNADNAKVSFAGWIKGLNQQAKAESEWADNVTKAAKRGVSQGVLAEMAKLPNGALRMKQLADGTDGQIKRVNADYASVQKSVRDTNKSLQSIKAPKTPQIDVNLTPAQQKMQAFHQQLENFHAPLIGVDVNTAPAAATLYAFGRENWTATLNVKTNVSKNALPGLATGGQVRGPGTSTSDSVPAMLSNGEHVWSASDVAAAGGQGAMYRMRGMAQSGMLHMASGGAVYKGHTLAYWQDKTANGLAVAQMRQSIKNDKDDLKETEKYGPKDKKGNQNETRYVLRGIDRTVGQKQLKADEKALADALYANKLNDSYRGTIAQRVNNQAKAKTQAANAAAKAKTKASNAAAAAKTERGNVVGAIRSDDPTDSRADAMSLASAARTEGNSKTLSAKQRKSLSKEADAATASFKKLYAQAAGIDKKLATAKTHLADLKSIASDASSTVKGSFDLSSAYSDATTSQVQHVDALGNVSYTAKTTPAGYSASALLSTGGSEAKTARAFSTGLKKLQTKLGSGPAAYAITQQAMTQFGSDPAQGVEFVNALNSMSIKQLGTLKNDYKSITSAGTSVGNTVASADSAGGITAANKSANTLAKSLDRVTASIGKVGDTLTNAMLKPYGLKLNAKGSIVKRAFGGPVTGTGTGTSDSIPALLSNGEHVWTAAEVRAAGGQTEVAKLRTAALAGRARFSGGGAAVLGPRQPVFMAATQQRVPSAPQEVRVELPRELVVVDSDGSLVGRMRVEAGRAVVAHSAGQDRASAYVRN